MSGPRLNVLSRNLKNSGLGLAIAHITEDGSSHTFIDQDVTTTGTPTFASMTTTGDVIVGGDMTINGSATIISTEIFQVQDNIIELNFEQTGTPPVGLKSGLEVQRGDETSYQIVFQESDDSVRIGEIGSLQAIATREDTPLANGIAIWNSTSLRFDSRNTIALDISYTGSNSSSIGTGAITTTGGIGITQDMFVGGTVNWLGDTISSTVVANADDLNLDVTGGPLATGTVHFLNTTQSTDTDTGAVVIEGGLGVEKNQYIGGNLEVAGTIDLGAVSIGGTGVTIDVDSVSALLVRKDGDLGDIMRVDTDTLSVAVTDAFENEAGSNLGSAGTDALGSSGTNEVLFSADNDTLEIGLATPFTKIIVVLGTVSSDNISATFGFSDGGGGFTSFTPTDGTTGFTSDGTIMWEFSDVAGWTADTVNGVSSRYWIKITRTADTVTTPPTEETIKLGVHEGKVTIGGTTASTNTARLVFVDSVASNRKIVLQGDGNDNEHQFVGMGVNTGEFRYQVDGGTTDHVWYGATSATASQELFRVSGDGEVISESKVIIDSTNAEAFLVRKNGDSGDLFTIDSSSETITANAAIIIDDTETVAFRVQKNGVGDDVFTVNSAAGSVTIREDTVGGDSTVLQLANFDNDTSSSSTMAFRLYDSGNNETVYSTIGGGIQDNTNGTEDGSLIFSLATAGTLTQAMKMTADTNLSLFETKITVNTTSADALLVEKDNGTDVFSVDSSGDIVKIFSATAASSTTSGAFQVIGGVGIGDDLYVGGDMVLSGDLTVNGTTTTVNSTTLEVDDNIILANATPGSVGEDAGMIVRRYQTANNGGTGDVVNSIVGEFTSVNVLAAGSSATAVQLDDDATLQAVTTINEITNNQTLFTGQLDFFSGWWLRVTAKGAGGEAVGSVRRIKSSTAAVSPVCTIYDTSDGGSDGLDFVTTPDDDNVVSLYSCPYAATVYNESKDEWMITHTALDPASGSAVVLQGYANMHFNGVAVQGNISGVGDFDTELVITGGENSGDNLILRSTTDGTKGQVYVDETTASSSSTTGALRVGGGVGVGDDLYIGSQLHVGSTSTSVEVNFQGRTQIRGSSNTNQLAVIDAGQSDLFVFRIDTLIDGGPDQTGSLLRVTPGTYNDSVTAASGAAANEHVFTRFVAPTLTATNSNVTTSDAATVMIAGAPIAGTNQTITESYALWVDSGITRLDGIVDMQDTTEASTIGTAAVTLDGGLSVAKNVLVGGDLYVTSAAGTDRELNFQTAGSNRWIFRAESTAEGGSDAGSDLQIVRVADNGTTEVNAITVDRSSGDVVILSTTDSTTSSSGALQVTGGIGVLEATDATNSTNGGAITASGGLAIAKKAFVGTDLDVGGNSAFGADVSVNSAYTVQIADDKSGTSNLSQLRVGDNARTFTSTGGGMEFMNNWTTSSTHDISNQTMSSIHSHTMILQNHTIDDASGDASGTITNSATLYIEDAPVNSISGTATITNGPYALFVNGTTANSRFAGNLEVNGNLSGSGLNTSPTLTDTSVSITAIADNSGTTEITAAGHGLAAGDIVVITGSNSTPTIDGTFTVLASPAPTGTTFDISDQSITVAGTAGTAFVDDFALRTNIASTSGTIIASNARTIRIGDEIMFSCTFRFTPTAADLETIFEVNLPILTTNLTNVYDVNTSHNGWITDATPTNLANINAVGVAGTRRLKVEFTAINNTEVHTVQVQCRYTV